jgi:ElaB/YqjD/DUF883 family membrane-anchored ribosome-binding protein
MDDDSRGKGSGTTESAEDTETSRFGRAKDYANEKYSAASDAMKDQYNKMRERVDDVDFGEITDQVRTYVRSNPGKALLISVGVGFLVGMLLRRSDEDDD